MALEGKGIFIWKVHKCEGGNPAAIARRATEAGFSHVLIKIADGPRAYNVDLAAPVVEALKASGIQVWGWQFVYGNEPFGEADIAIHRIRTLDLAGFVINAEIAYKGKNEAASAYMESLSRRTSIPLALSSFRYPNYHRELPWAEFLSRCDINMPQVYWVQADNPDQQLDRSIAQFESYPPVLPIIPTGAAYEEFGWRPQPAEITRFLQHVRQLGIPAANFWSWDYAGSSEGRDLWEAISDFDWPVSQPSGDVIDMLIDALNRRDIGDLVDLYQPNATHITAQSTVQGKSAIDAHYTALLDEQLPGARFDIESRVNEGHIRHVKWNASGAANGRSVRRGMDTIGLRQGKIQYHSSVYQIV
jgi:hypothetical protein